MAKNEEFILNVNTNADAVTEKFSSLRKQVKDADLAFQKASVTFGEYSQQAIEAAKKVAELRDRVGDAKAQVDAFKPGGGFKAIAEVGQVAASGFAAATGAMSLFGVQSESTEQALLKVQSAMALAQGLGALAEAGDAFKNMGAAVKANSVVMGIWNFITTGSISAQEGLAVATSEETAVLVLNTTATEAQVVATEEAVVSTEAQAVATEATTVATEGATIAATGLRAALSAIGIGLLISAIAYLVTNFKDIKKYVTELFPSLDGFGEKFNKIKEVAVGVGSAIINYLVTPFKVIGKLISGDFKGALEEIKNGFNVIGNYEAGASKQRLNNAISANEERLKADIEHYDQLIKRRKAAGQDTYDLDLKQLAVRKKLAGDDKEAIKKIDEEIYLAKLEHNKKLSSIKVEKPKVNKTTTKEDTSDFDLLNREADTAIKANEVKEKIDEDYINSKLTSNELLLKNENKDFEKRKRYLEDNNQSIESLVAGHKDRIKVIEDKANQEKLDAENQYNNFIMGFKIEGNKTEKEQRELATQKLLESNKKSADDEIKLLIEKYSKLGVITKEGEEKIQAVKDQASANAKQIMVNSDEIELQARLNKWSKSLDMATQFLGQIGSMLDQADGQRITNIQNQNQQENDELEAKHQKELSKKGLTEVQKKAIDDKYAKLKLDNDKKTFIETEKIKKEQFERDKLMKMAEIVMNTASGIMQIWGHSPDPTGISQTAMTAYISAIGALQFAAVSSTSYQGGTPPSGGGGGSVSLNSDKNDQAIPNNPLNLNGGRNEQNTFGNKEDILKEQHITVTAVVSETEITQTQGRIAKIKQSAEL